MPTHQTFAAHANHLDQTAVEPYASAWYPAMRPIHTAKGQLHALSEMGRAAAHSYYASAEYLLQLQPSMIHTAWSRMVQGFCHAMEHNLRAHQKHEFNFSASGASSDPANDNRFSVQPVDNVKLDDIAVGVQIDIIDEQSFGRLKHFSLHQAQNGEKFENKRPPMLIVAPMSGHFDTLLTDTVKRLLADYDVYITDWADAADVPLSEGHFDLNSYIHYLKDNWLPLINERHQPEGAERTLPTVHTMAVCQPGVPLSAAIAMMNEDNSAHTPLSMTLMGSPIDTRISPTAVNDFATERNYDWFLNNAVTQIPFGRGGTGRLTYPGWQQLFGFMSMNADKHIDGHTTMMKGFMFEAWDNLVDQTYFDHLMLGNIDKAKQKRGFYEEYKTVCDLPIEFYLQTIDHVFQRHLLPQGQMPYTDPASGETRLVDLSQITKTATMTIEGGRDDITGLGQTAAILDLMPDLADDQKLRYTADKVGHYGIFNGSTWRNEIAPHIINFTSQADNRQGHEYHMRSETRAVMQELNLAA